MTESKNPRLSEGFVVTEDALRTALDEFRANLIAMAMLEAPPAPEELCADCKHPKSDSRFHLEAPGDNWGAALHHFVPAPASQPVSAPAEKKEWVTALELEDLLEKFCEETVWARGEINQPELLKAIDSILASRIEAHIAAALGNSTCHQAMCRDELLWRASIEAHIAAAFQKCVDIIERSPTFHNHSAIKTLCWCDMCSYVRGNVTEIRALTPASVVKALELAEVRAALKEAHLLYTNWNVDESFRTFEKFFEAHYKTLQAREAELLARGGK